MTTQNDKAIEQLEQVILAMKEELSKIDIRGLALSEYYSGQSMMLKRFIAGIQCRVQSLKQSVSTDADAKEGGIRYASIEGVEEKAKQILADHKEGFKYLKDK